MFYGKTYEQPGDKKKGFFEQKRRLLWASLLGAENWLRRVRFFWRKKEGMLGDFSGAENRACWVFLLQQNNQICMQIG